MKFMEFLHVLPTVLQVLTAERTQDKLKDMTEDVAEAVDAVNHATQSAASDIISIFEDLLDDLDELHGTGYQESLTKSRNMRTPGQQMRIEKVRAIFEELAQ